MIFIRSRRIKVAINKAIEERNSYNSKKIPFYDEEKGIDEESLGKIYMLNIGFTTQELEDVHFEELIEDLSNVAKYMGKTKNGMFTSLNVDVYGITEENNNMNLLAFNNIDNNIEQINFKFYNMVLNKKNLSDLSKLNCSTILSVDENGITDKNREEIKRFCIENNQHIFSKDEELEQYLQKFCKFRSKILDKKINILDYDEEYLSIDKNDYTIIIDNDVDVESEEVKERLKKINNKKILKFELSVAAYDKIKELLDEETDISLIIKDASELPTDKVKRDEKIQRVLIRDGDDAEKMQTNSYTREEYIKVREKIDNILKEIVFENPPKKDSQKKAFYQIYKRLAEIIEYDHDIVEKENKYEKGKGIRYKEKEITSRNMIGGLLEGKAVCVGYADILKNVCACAGIEAKCVESNKFLPGPGHEWNSVKLDGEWFNADLTWDRNDIVKKRFPLKYFLRSDEFFDFGHIEYPITYKRLVEPLCKRDILIGEQKAIQEGRDISESDKDIVIGLLSIAENQLETFVDLAIERGLVKGSTIRNVGSKTKTFIEKIKNFKRSNYGENTIEFDR